MVNMEVKIDPEKEKKQILSAYRGLLRVAKHVKTKEDKKLVRKAFELAMDAHSGMRRKSGEPYILHPLAVARIVAEEIRLGTTAIVGAILHDTVEDTNITLEDIEHQFGSKVCAIIDGLTKIKDVFDHTASLQAENFKKMLLTLSDDIRVILIKIADRLHNMRTLRFMPPHKQLSIAEETLEIFAPLANRLGINHIKNELEDIAFRYLEPERYEQLQRQVRMHHQEREDYVQRSIKLLDDRLTQEGLTFELSGRSKHLYSIARKMERDKRNLDQIFDLMAIRAILEPEHVGNGMAPEDAEKAVCYRALASCTRCGRPSRAGSRITWPCPSPTATRACTPPSSASWGSPSRCR